MLDMGAGRQLAAFKIVTIWMCIGAAASIGQSTRPTTMPVAVQDTTPRGALRALNQAIRTGDAAGMLALFLATTPSEQRMADADAQTAAALAHLRRAATQAFGEPGARLVMGNTPAGDAESAARIESADITINGDTATVTYRDERESPFVLKRVNGHWRVPVSEFGKPLDQAALDQQLADLAAQRELVLEVTRNIELGKLTSAEQARDAWHSRMFEAATSQPATRPSIRGAGEG